MSAILNEVANSISGIFASILEVFIWIIFVLIYTYFMLYHRRLLYRFVTGLFRNERLSEVNEVIIETRTIINHYIIGLLLEMGIMTIVNCSVFAIMGIKYSLFLGMLAAVLNIIPYLGIYTAILICMLVTFTNGGGASAISVGVVLIVIHFLDANILMPRIVGSRVKMNALITILAVVIGNQIWGIAGMLLFIPLVAILKIIFEHVDGLASWALLIGSEEKEDKRRKL
jgi:AI-2 transport protein TqsA